MFLSMRDHSAIETDDVKVTVHFYSIFFRSSFEFWSSALRMSYDVYYVRVPEHTVQANEIRYCVCVLSSCGSASGVAAICVEPSLFRFIYISSLIFCFYLLYTFRFYRIRRARTHTDTGGADVSAAQSWKPAPTAVRYQSEGERAKGIKM